MQRPVALTFASFLAVPENQSALSACQQIAEGIENDTAQGSINPLYLHGQTGTGKSHLVAALIDELTRRRPNLIVTLIAGGDTASLARLADDSEATDWFDAARHSDVLVVEDLQYLTPRHAGALIRAYDHLLPRRAQMVFTASSGPRQLPLPGRLTSRLQCGLVVGINPLPAPSRLMLLADKAQRRQLAVSRDVLAWLAEHLVGGGRQIDGALARLELLTRTRSQPLDVATLADHFRELLDTVQPSVERIARKVGSHFKIDLGDMRSEQRGRHVVLPRQVGMYLARQLTGLSLGEIGDYFGGRDHSTVLHACRKVERALIRDVVLSGTVRQLYLDLA